MENGEISTTWLKILYVLLIIQIVFGAIIIFASFGYLVKDESNAILAKLLCFDILQVAIKVAVVATRKRIYGFYLIISSIVADAVFMLFTSSGNAYNIIGVFIASLAWSVPNVIYIYKRKSLYENYESEQSKGHLKTENNIEQVVFDFSKEDQIQLKTEESDESKKTDSKDNEDWTVNAILGIVLCIVIVISVLLYTQNKL